MRESSYKQVCTGCRIGIASLARRDPVGGGCLNKMKRNDALRAKRLKRKNPVTNKFVLDVG